MKKLLLSLLFFASFACQAWDHSDVVELNPHVDEHPVIVAFTGDMEPMAQSNAFTPFKTTDSAAAILGANFDGSNDYLDRGAGLTGAADSKSFLFGVRIRFTGGDGSTQKIIAGASDRIVVQKDTSNIISVIASNSSGTQILNITADATALTADGSYHTILVNVQQSATSTHQIYIDGTEQSLTTNTDTDDTIDFTLANYGIGANFVGGSKVDADIDWLYFQDGENLDISSSANRAKFDDLSTASDGSTPTGTNSIVFLNGRFDVWHTNKGTGGGFTENGELTEPAS